MSEWLEWVLGEMLLSSHFGVTCTVEKRLTPRITQALVELSCLNGMSHICILKLSIDWATIGHLLVCELEEVTVKDLIAIFFKNLQESGLITWVHILMELCKGDEVLPIHSMISIVAQCERANIEAGFSGKDATSHSWLIFIQWLQLDPRVCVLPESTKPAHHVTAWYTKHIINNIKLVWLEMISGFAFSLCTVRNLVDWSWLTQSESCSRRSGRSAKCPWRTHLSQLCKSQSSCLAGKVPFYYVYVVADVLVIFYNKTLIKLIII